MYSRFPYIFNSVLQQPRFLAILVALLLFGILLTIGSMVFYQVRSDTLQQEARTREDLRAREVADKIESYLISARQLAASAASLVAPLRDDKTLVEQTLTRLLLSAPAETIHGVGAWFEPRRFDQTTRYFGPYAHRAPNAAEPPVLTYEWTSEAYDFHGQAWYQAGKKAKGQLSFTEPYFDSGLVYMSAAQAFFNQDQRFIGVVTVDMVLPLLSALIQAENTHPQETIYVTTAQGKLFVHPQEQALLKFARANAYPDIQSILQLEQSFLRQFDGFASDELANHYISSNKAVPLTGWTVHVEAEKDFLLAPINELSRFIGLMVLVLWVIIILGVVALLRLSVLSFEALKEEQRHEAEHRERLKTESKLQQAREEQALLEQKVAERTKELSHAYKRLKASQTQLVQAEKMSSLGQMVAGLAHEINTPLGYIRNNVEMIKRSFKDVEGLMTDYDKLMLLLAAEDADEELLGEQMQAALEKSSDFRENEVIEETFQLIEDSHYGVEQISELVGNLKDFSRLDLAMVENINMNESLDKVLKIAHHKLKNKVVVKKQYAEPLPKVKCSPSQINQVFLNLLTNAAQAIAAEQGEIVLKTWADKGMVHVAVQDNGTGIPKDKIGKIFDPFFTTKPIGEGTGLGLSISHQIIRQHQGSIRVASEVGKGTRFTVSLPV